MLSFRLIVLALAHKSKNIEIHYMGYAMLQVHDLQNLLVCKNQRPIFQSESICPF